MHGWADAGTLTTVLRERVMSNFTNPKIQAMNLVRYIGDRVSESGEPIKELPNDIGTIIGSPSRQLAWQLMEELVGKNILQARIENTHPGKAFSMFNLTLEGWEQYEAERRGQSDGNYGFLAMQFGEPELDTFVREVLKPTVEEAGYELHDMNDASRAGVIDNIMRVKIRDSKFVIADLTHDNNGAYWEAGYAEGLGKPVIFICEKRKFEDEGTHFDTNHCTTVPWSRDDGEGFKQRLTATLRRSLDQS